VRGGEGQGAEVRVRVRVLWDLNSFPYQGTKQKKNSQTTKQTTKIKKPEHSLAPNGVLYVLQNKTIEHSSLKMC
jgi:hypothetical protein